jgi:hypothetical protein
MRHTSNPRSLEGTDQEDHSSSLDYTKVSETSISTNKPGVVVYARIPAI